MFNLDKKFASIQLVADVIKTLGKSFDVVSKATLQNKYDIILKQYEENETKYNRKCNS